MSRLNWDETGKRKYENGISHGVLYTQYPQIEFVPNASRDINTDRMSYHPGTGGYRIYGFGAIGGNEFAICPAYIGEYPTGWNVDYEVIDGIIVPSDPNIYRTRWINAGTIPPSYTTAWVNTNIIITRTELENLPKDKALAKLTNVFSAANEASGENPVRVYNYRLLTTSTESSVTTQLAVIVDNQFVGSLAADVKSNYTSVWEDQGRPFSGVVWNGLTNVSESPDGAEANDMWADNMKYSSPRSKETFGMTIEAYTYPDEFSICDGTKQPIKGVKLGQQTRLPFCMTYRTEVGNDTGSEDDDSYLLHLVYNCTASPSDRSYETINDSPDAITFSWECDTTPQQFSNYDYSPVSTIVIDSSKVKDLELNGRKTLTTLEEILYGNLSKDATMPSPDYVVKLFMDSTVPNSEQQPEPEAPVEG